METLEAVFLNLSVLAMLAGLGFSLMALRYGLQGRTGRVAQEGKEPPAWVGRLAAACVGLSLVALLMSLAMRGIRAWYWPLTSSYEFALACVAAMLLTWLALQAQPQGGMAAASGILLLAILTLAYARLGIPAAAQRPRPPSPVLDSLWLQLHVLTLAMAYGALGAAASCGLLHLTQGWLGRLSRGIYHVEPQGLEDLTLWAMSLGFPWLTVAMIAGMIWAEMAWGIYWNWEPKEVLTLATWVICLIYLHARTIRGWRGRPLALLVVLSLLLAIINYLWAGSLARSLAWEVLRVY